MILKPIKPPLPILHRCHRALLAPRHHFKPIRQPRRLVTMTHPNHLLLPNPLISEQARVFLHLNLHSSILLLLTNADLTSQLLDNQLQPVANSQHKNTIFLRPLDEPRRETWCVRGMNGVRTAGENNNTWVEVGDGFEGRRARDTERENRETPDSTSDEVCILRAIVEDQNKVGFDFLWVHAGRF